MRDFKTFMPDSPQQTEHSFEHIYEICEKIGVEKTDELLKESGISISMQGRQGNAFVVNIDGKDHSFAPLKLKLKEFEAKLKQMLNVSAGKAITWLKKNAELISSKK